MLSKDEAAEKKSGYSKQDVNRFINRGVVFFKSGEGNVVPCNFKVSDGLKKNIQMLTYDNNQKSFLKEKFKQEAELSGSKWSKAIQAGIFIITIFVCAALFFITIFYLNNSLTESISEISRSLASQAINNTAGVGA